MTFLQPIITIPSFVLLLILCGYIGVPLWLWSLFAAATLWVFKISIWGWVLFGILVLIFNIPQLRRVIVTSAIVKIIKALKLLPTISDTEEAAIKAGTLWVEGEFFSGKPNFKRINSESYPQLNPEIQAFLDGPVEQVCRMTTDWDIHCRKDLPPEVWDYLKQQRFFGMMIPKKYGGLGFSNLAYSAVMTKLASRSFTHTATVGVTNSLGPAKLLLHYGTQTQKDYYLPRLARGEEIPCFALTEPHAGSDAANITSNGVVFKGADDKLYLRLNWRKRFITLGTIATLLGLAFKLRDPDNLLGKGEDLGITCALIPTDTPGVVLGQRHDPMGVPFYNSPTEGHDVIVPIEHIIGGIAQAGQGWKMLMQCLAAGRGIGFPATCTGIAKLVARVTGAHAVVRKQFGLSIGRFEGIEEPLARIGGLTYLMDAARLYTCGAVDQGEKPAVISAIAKYNFTELSRQIINDGMDILGGAGICRGPRNLLANIYMATPIPITVEGANILTRTMIIFGQGVIRAHPYVYQEIEALNQSNLKAFDQALWNHFGLMVRNFFRSVLLSVSRGYLAVSPVKGPTAKYYRKLTWASATFAFLTDMALIYFGGTLKRREKLTGRFADILSWMYLGVATLRRFEAQGRKSEDLPFVDWAMQYAFAQIQQAMMGIFSNMLGLGLRELVTCWWRLNPIGVPPSDQLGSTIARSLQTLGSQRDKLTTGIYIPSDTSEALGRLEQAFLLSSQAESIIKKIKLASSAGKLPKGRWEQLFTKAVEVGVISVEEVKLVREAESARNDAIQVDAFSLDEYQQGGQLSDRLTREPMVV
ncbi:MAG: acyl-CoA dehydrogenase [Symploca sp. SIO1C4]|uniref:Acyl-coenzyme A dehydrogenase n=1 Tax=Symploca sp. SIO1C4 TaxID=2607765 RepID=A0A6B3N744_9CYAN|nr:acyl-CoA dehydrogenase [Symploca sp. SIO1C4]